MLNKQHSCVKKILCLVLSCSTFAYGLPVPAKTNFAIARDKEPLVSSLEVNKHFLGLTSTQQLINCSNNSFNDCNLLFNEVSDILWLKESQRVLFLQRISSTSIGLYTLDQFENKQKLFEYQAWKSPSPGTPLQAMFSESLDPLTPWKLI